MARNPEIPQPIPQSAADRVASITTVTPDKGPTLSRRSFLRFGGVALGAAAVEASGISRVVFPGVTKAQEAEGAEEAVSGAQTMPNTLEALSAPVDVIPGDTPADVAVSEDLVAKETLPSGVWQRDFNGWAPNDLKTFENEYVRAGFPMGPNDLTEYFITKKASQVSYRALARLGDIHDQDVLVYASLSGPDDSNLPAGKKNALIIGVLSEKGGSNRFRLRIVPGAGLAVMEEVIEDENGPRYNNIGGAPMNIEQSKDLYKARIIVYKNHITAYIDGKQVGIVRDLSQYGADALAGQISLGVMGQGEVTARYKNPSIGDPGVNGPLPPAWGVTR